jgi:hypothetical protein
MFKRNGVIKYVDNLGVEHPAKVEAESLFETAIRGMHRIGLKLPDGRGRVVCYNRVPPFFLPNSPRTVARR